MIASYLFLRIRPKPISVKPHQLMARCARSWPSSPFRRIAPDASLAICEPSRHVGNDAVSTRVNRRTFGLTVPPPIRHIGEIARLTNCAGAADNSTVKVPPINRRHKNADPIPEFPRDFVPPMGQLISAIPRKGTALSFALMAVPCIWRLSDVTAATFHFPNAL